MYVGRLLGLDSGAKAAYYQQVRTEVLASWPRSERSSAIGLANEILGGKDKQEIPDWNAITKVEVELILVINSAHLRLKYMRLRDELAGLAGSELAALYLTVVPVDPGSLDDETLRSHCIDMLSQVHRFRALRRAFNKIRSYATAFATTLAFAFFFIVVSYFMGATWLRSSAVEPQKAFPFATTMLVLTGMLGGCVSALSRLYSVSWVSGIATGTDSLGHVFWNLVMNFVIAVIEGGLFAIFLYLAFMGGLISGSLFPKFVPNVSDLFHVQLERGLDGHNEYAKALVWAFVAGFSERLVPDFLGTFGGHLKTQATS